MKNFETNDRIFKAEKIIYLWTRRLRSRGWQRAPPRRGRVLAQVAEGEAAAGAAAAEAAAAAAAAAVAAVTAYRRRCCCTSIC